MIESRVADDETAVCSDLPLLHEIFDRALILHANEIALEIPPSEGFPERRQYTYSDLDRLADAYCLDLSGVVEDECIVAVLLPRTSEHLWAAQLGILRTGAAYLCLDPDLPDEVVRKTLIDAEPAAIIADTNGLARCNSLGIGHQVFVPTTETGNDEVHFLRPEFSVDRLAYVIYTSGTTGAPKGVMIEHQSITNLVLSDIKEFAIRPGDRIAQGSSPSYDSSVEETWLAFAAGATLVVMDDATSRLGPDLVTWLTDNEITMLCPPPTLLRTMGCEDPRMSLPKLRLLYVGGEALTSDVADVWAPGRRLVNGYGPTECTVTCVRSEVFAGEPITIGMAIDGVTAHVLNETGNPVPMGERGELCLGGLSLARGYRNAPDLTERKFGRHEQLGRIYRTGDLVSSNAQGKLSYYGRIDAQVKLRGFRIELEAIETVLATFPGIREAACKLQREGTVEWLSAHIVSSSTPDWDELREMLGQALPWYMTPTAFELVDSLPKTVGGKIKRDALPLVHPTPSNRERSLTLPRTEKEALIASACQRLLSLTGPVSVTEDFFLDLGGSSLGAAQLVSFLRKDPETASITVRDIYQARTIEEIALRALPSGHVEGPPEPRRPSVSTIPATVTQALLLAMELVVVSAAAAWFLLDGIPWLDSFGGVFGFLVVLPVVGAAAFVVYTPVSIALAVLTKKLIIGKYRATVEPVWSQLFLRNWIVRQVLRIVPWQQIEGTELANMALRALGAKIGKDVHFHHGSLPLQGGWDLLEIGDRVTLGQDCVLGLSELESSNLIFGPVSLGQDAVVGTRAIVSHHGSMGHSTTLTDLSLLATGDHIPESESWSGIRATANGRSRPIPECTGVKLSGFVFGSILLFGRALISWIEFLPLQISLVGLYYGVGQSKGTIDGFLFDLSWTQSLALTTLVVGISMPATLLLKALLARILGLVKPGVLYVQSPGFARVSLKSLLVESSGRWLSGTLFWPVWLRAAGMNVGKDCEISTIIDVVPELVSIDSHVFFADGVYLCPPVIQGGTVTLDKLQVSTNCFIGNHSILPGGQTLPPDILIGVSTIADASLMQKGTSWFGLPPIELHRREIVAVDESLTHKPSRARYWNRVFWESLRFFVPVVPLFAELLWCDELVGLPKNWRGPAIYIGAASLDTLAIASGLCLLVLAMKWVLLGRVKEGIHPLWSCWCSRWDYLYVIWGEWARPILVNLEGTLLLIPYLRAMGMKIGKRVVLSSGFAHVVDPDMLVIEDDATVSATYQAHTFEDRVLKIGKVVIKRGATLGRSTVPLYGAVVGEGARVVANSVIMKHEHLLPGHKYEGAPCHAVRENP